jgi:hypothetical protein
MPSSGNRNIARHSENRSPPGMSSRMEQITDNIHSSADLKFAVEVPGLCGVTALR